MQVDARMFATLAAPDRQGDRTDRPTDEAEMLEVARQFESLFTQMLLKSMRAASFGDSLFSSQQTEFYRDMHDQQLSVALSRTSGLGLADLLVRQFGGAGGPVRPEPSLRAVTGGGLVGRADAPAVADDTRSHASVAHADWMPHDPVEFVRDLWPHARRAAHKLGVAPQLVIAQAALETGWGRHPIRAADGTNSLNLFGIKTGASWRGPSATVPTLEVENGTATRRHAAFRVYDSIADSVGDYVRLLGSAARYSDVTGSGADALKFGTALMRGGYATDPDYAAKLEHIASGETLRAALDALKIRRILPTN